MPSFNKVILVGNLTRDPELRYTGGGVPVANFSIAINRRYRQNEEQREETVFVDIVVFQKQAENCAQYLSKGRSVLVEGRLVQRSWTTDEGQKRNKIEVLAQNVQFLGQAGGGRGKGEDVPAEGAPEHDVDSGDDIPF